MRSPLFLPCPLRQPINYCYKRPCHEKQSRVSRRKSHVPQNKNVSERHQRRRHENNQVRLIHVTLSVRASVYAPGRYVALLVSVSQIAASVSRAPGGSSVNCFAVSSKKYRAIFSAEGFTVLNGSRSLMN